ncbi:MAG: AraC family transcriptional regulator [Bifidobacteriaceae bacterium]|jgi:AraC-like DNA-binding protein|nr:AraC family transcriptional regulator [Bifidobacteriaceae bacterium]
MSWESCIIQTKMTRDAANPLLGGLDLTQELVALWADLPGAMFAVKDAAGRYVEVNEAFVRRSSARSRTQALGRTARELFLPDLAERYEAQDAEVMASGRPLRGELEAIRAQGGEPAWCLTTKLPVFREESGGRRAVGVVTVSTPLAALGSSDQIGESLTRVISLVRASLAADPPRVPSVAEMARAGGTSASTLKRNMRKVFGLAPRAYVLLQRIDRAMSLLADTDLPISKIATYAGFYDQPSLTRQFVRLTGETPAVFRRGARA